MLATKFNCILRLIRDFDRCYQFYSRVLGLKVISVSFDDYAILEINNRTSILIYTHDTTSSVLDIASEYATQHSRGNERMVLAVENVDQSYEDFISRGITFVSLPMEISARGMRTAKFLDPEENLVEIYSETAVDE